MINLESGKVYTFGKGAYNRLGLSTTQNVHTPTLVESLKNKKVKQISAGCRHGHCLT
jgi:alpha-tubulin suppressor-like RCC1 family protein